MQHNRQRDNSWRKLKVGQSCLGASCCILSLRRGNAKLRFELTCNTRQYVENHKGKTWPLRCESFRRSRSELWWLENFAKSFGKKLPQTLIPGCTVERNALQINLALARLILQRGFVALQNDSRYWDADSDRGHNLVIEHLNTGISVHYTLRISLECFTKLCKTGHLFLAVTFWKRRNRNTIPVHQ